MAEANLNKVLKKNFMTNTPCSASNYLPRSSLQPNMHQLKVQPPCTQTNFPELLLVFRSKSVLFTLCHHFYRLLLSKNDGTMSAPRTDWLTTENEQVLKSLSIGSLEIQLMQTFLGSSWVCTLMMRMCSLSWRVFNSFFFKLAGATLCYNTCIKNIYISSFFMFFFHVFIHIFFFRKVLVTKRAFVPDSQMNFWYMLFQFTGKCKSLWTLLTLIGFIFMSRFDVLAQRALRCKTFGTLATREGLGPFMHIRLMSFELGRKVKWHLTHLTTMWLI